MTICIIHESGTFWTNAESVVNVVDNIKAGANEIDVWWFAGQGQRYRESMWFDPEHLIAVRTESDD